MLLSEVLINIGLGLCLGTIGGLFGIGGGLVAIPMLGLLFGLDQHLAQGTALVMVVPNVMLALWRYNQRNRLNWRWAAVLAVAGFCWALIGANVATSLSNSLMRYLFVGFLLLLILYNGWRLYRPLLLAQGAHPPTTGRLALLGTVAGLAGGLFGVGGAVVATPVLTSVFGLSQVLAQGLALAMALPSTAVTLATFAAHGQVAWGMGLALSCGGLLSISWGVRMAHAVPDRLLRMLFCGFLLACSAGLLLQ